MSMRSSIVRAIPRLNRWLQGVAVASSVESGGKPASVNTVGVSAVLSEIAPPPNTESPPDIRDQ